MFRLDSGLRCSDGKNSLVARSCVCILRRYIGRRADVGMFRRRLEYGLVMEGSIWLLGMFSVLRRGVVRGWVKIR